MARYTPKRPKISRGPRKGPNRFGGGGGKGQFNRTHRHGVLKKKFAVAKAKRSPGRPMHPAVLRKPGHGHSTQRALGTRPKPRRY